MNTKTYSPTASEAQSQRQWFIVDAEGKTLGRLASQIAPILRGKHKPTFATHMDMGDYVIVINADKFKTCLKSASAPPNRSRSSSPSDKGDYRRGPRKSLRNHARLYGSFLHPTGAVSIGCGS